MTTRADAHPASAAPAEEAMLTVGQLAERVLERFLAVQRFDEPKAAGLPANELVHGCLRLGAKFPAQTRRCFEACLPFTRLELALLRHGVGDDGPAEREIALRVWEWATRSPVFVDEANVHAGDFLCQLSVHLDLWSQRRAALDAAARLTAAIDAN